MEKPCQSLLTVIKFYLRTQERHRGDSQYVEVAGVPTAPIVVNIERVPARESLFEPEPLNRDPGFIEAQRSLHA